MCCLCKGSWVPRQVTQTFRASGASTLWWNEKCTFRGVGRPRWGSVWKQLDKHDVWPQGTALELYGSTSHHTQRHRPTKAMDTQKGQTWPLPSKYKSLHSLTHMYLCLIWFHTSILILLNYPLQMWILLVIQNCKNGRFFSPITEHNFAHIFIWGLRDKFIITSVIFYFPTWW